jgi:hypothetical protein
MPECTDDERAPATSYASRRRRGEVLVAEGTITVHQLEEALDGRLRTSKGRERLGQAIVRMDLATEEDTVVGSLGGVAPADASAERSV